MEKHPETVKTKMHLILRDHLAENRTALANERTMLAYIRTALTLFAVGLTFVKFFEYPLIEFIGWALIPLGVLTFIRGLISYRKMLRLIQKEEEVSQDSDTKQVKS